MNEINLIWIFLIFIIIGLISALSGTGGGALKVPLLMFFGYIISAVSISIFTNLFLSIPTTIINIKRKAIEYKISLFIIIGSFCGTFLGNLVYNFLILTNFLIYIIIFTLFIIFTSIRLLLSKSDFDTPSYKEKKILLNFKNGILAGLIGFGAGISSTLFGLGGGLVVTPLLVVLLNSNVHKAISTSIFVMNFTAFFGVVENYFQNYYTIEIIFVVIIVGSGVIIGSLIASTIFRRAHPKYLKYIFVSIALFLAVPLLWVSYFNLI
ncbi:MAG: sulfite exporter TauE/SafE family protein [Candidatus Helarchaeota archaeon]